MTTEKSFGRRALWLGVGAAEMTAGMLVFLLGGFVLGGSPEIDNAKSFFATFLSVLAGFGMMADGMARGTSGGDSILKVMSRS
ncbi:MAG: hypothetical protein AAB955_01980 [Patescibacteria group bacterium]